MPSLKKKPSSPSGDKPRRGCWTCKERRVSCDRTTPYCSNCTRSGRTCQGYGVRLSWPRDNDPKRAMRVHVASTPQHRYNEIRMVEMSPRDIELYEYLRRQDAMFSHHPSRLAYTPPVSPSVLGDANRNGPELLGYFGSVAYLSLANLGTGQANLGSFLVRMAVSGGSGSNLPATALLSALLAVSSLHRDGFQSQALRYKIAAIKALAESIRVGAPSSLEAAQHAAAGMLLAAFETHYKSESSGQWVLYVCGAKDIIETAHIEDRQDLTPLLDWVHYQHTISRFVLGHWRHWSTQSVITNTNNTVTPNERTYLGSKAKPLALPHPNASSNTILGPLSDMCDMLLEYSDPKSTENDYRSRLKALEWSVMGKPMTPPPLVSNPNPNPNPNDDTSDPTTTTSSIPQDATIMYDLYQLANSIYLIRIASDPASQTDRLAPILDRAFSLMVAMTTCDRFLPLILAGCEARDDDEKLIVLDLIARTRNKSNEGAIMCVETGIRLMWNQRDLELDDISVGNSYRTRLTGVISSACTLPVLV